LTVRLVLDTSALLAYVAADVRSVEVGELIATVEENGDTTGVPVSCLLAALARVGADERRKLFELTGAEGPILLLPLLAGDVPAIADLGTGLPMDAAHAAAARAEHDALLGTHDPITYKGIVDPDDILDLSGDLGTAP
jgi:predicted nucleic acid-binding protein